jgi:hypothetical protein
MFRAFYLVVIFGVWAISLFYMIPIRNISNSFFTTTSFLAALFYLIILTVSIVIYVYYFIKGYTTTTIIPCISSTWYRFYTFFILAFAIVLVIIASIETNKYPGGFYTSLPVEVGKAKCASKNDWWEMGGLRNAVLGLAVSEHLAAPNNRTKYPLPPAFGNNSFGDGFSVYNFSGYCIGGVV